MTVHSFDEKGRNYWLGLSGDTKPVPVAATPTSSAEGPYPGDLFVETDTENWFIYDGSAWDPITPDVGSSITVTASALPANAAKETGGNLAAAKADLDSLVASLAASSALNITDTADHVVKNGAGTLVSVILNTAAAISTLKVYDGITAGGTLLATIDGTGATPQPEEYNIAVSTGVFAKATGTANWTVTYK